MRPPYLILMLSLVLASFGCDCESVPDRARALLVELNSWDKRETDRVERPDAHSATAGDGESEAFIASRKKKLRNLGFEASWDSQTKTYSLKPIKKPNQSSHPTLPGASADDINVGQIKMSTFEVTFQLVDSPVEKSESGGVVGGDGLVTVFRAFPFAKEIARAKEGATFPTITFKRQGDGEEVAIWTVDDKCFDLCLIKDGKKSFLNNRKKDEVANILTRFDTESVVTFRPRNLWSRMFG